MEQDLLEVSRRLSRALAPGDLDGTLARITAAAVEVLPEVDLSSITVRHSDGRLESFAVTDPLLEGIDAAQRELREGPCFDAATDSVHVTAPDLAHDPRYPRYAPTAVAAGVRAQAGIRLFETPSTSGALNLYSRRAGAFATLDGVGHLFAHQAALALSYAREITQLSEAVRTRQTIGQAVGVVMERFSLDEARAFAFLTRISQDTNTKLRVIAERLLEMGSLDED